MTRNLHRNIHLLRSLQSERDLKYQSDKAEEVMIARTCEFNNMPIKASTAPSKNGFIFSNEEIAAAAVRKRHVDTSLYIMKNRSPSDLYRTLPLGFGDSYLEKTEKEPETRPFSVHPEILALDCLNNPDDYGVKP